MQTKRKRIQRGEIIRTILLILAASGIVAAGITCPNLLQLVPLSYRKRYPANSIRKALYLLDEKGWIVVRQLEAGWKIHLTKRGQKEILAYELGQKYLTKPKKWDKKWRLLIFDIPEKRKYIREKIRSVLRNFGFLRLQDSVWVYPYECSDILELLRTKYYIRGEALYIRAEHLDQDRWLQKEFELQ